MPTLSQLEKEELRDKGFMGLMTMKESQQFEMFDEIEAGEYEHLRGPKNDFHYIIPEEDGVDENAVSIEDTMMEQEARKADYMFKQCIITFEGLMTDAKNMDELYALTDRIAEWELYLGLDDGQLFNALDQQMGEAETRVREIMASEEQVVNEQAYQLEQIAQRMWVINNDESLIAYEQEYIKCAYEMGFHFDYVMALTVACANRLHRAENAQRAYDRILAEEEAKERRARAEERARFAHGVVMTKEVVRWVPTYGGRTTKQVKPAYKTVFSQVAYDQMIAEGYHA